MSSAAALVERLESLGVALFPGPEGELRYRARKPVSDETRRLLDELRNVREEAAALVVARRHPCVDCHAEAGTDRMLCRDCEDARRIVILDEAELLRRRVIRRDRTLRDLAGRYCGTCGFSCWAVTGRGDSSCYGCRLLARGTTPRCGRCKRQEWRVEDGRRVCRYCEAARFAGGDTHQGAPEIARPGATSREVSEPGGAA